jgi:hypothetical protein
VFYKDPKLPRVALRDGTLTSTARVREQVSVADLAQCCESILTSCWGRPCVPLMRAWPRTPIRAVIARS